MIAASGSMKQSIVGQAGGEEQMPMPMEYIKKNEDIGMFGNEDQDDKEMRINNRIDRLEKWNAMKQASKSKIYPCSLD
jgi:hypothetical protein